jgi:hypothetical protein
MISIKQVIFATVCATAMMASSALADTYICKHGDKERVISVVYEKEGQPVPCKVVYTKDTGVETPWNAQNQAGYCEEKAAAFVEKQRTWGWTCEKQEAAQEQAPAAE